MRLVALDPAPRIRGSALLLPPPSADSVLTPPHSVLDVSPQHLARLDRYGLLGLLAARLALRKVELEVPDVTAEDAGVVFGSSLSCSASNGRYVSDLATKSLLELSPATFIRTVSNAVNGEVSIALRLGGVNETFVSGWAAGIEALIAAASEVARGRHRWVLAGAVEAPGERDRAIWRAHSRNSGMAWLPRSLAEGAAVCVVASGAGEERRGPRVLAFARGHDPRGTWSPSHALETATSFRPAAIVLTTPVPPVLAVRWREEAEARGCAFIDVGDRDLALGAVGGLAALARPEAWARACRDEGGRALLVARGLHGEMASIVVSP